MRPPVHSFVRMDIRFVGAAGSVTGSSTLVENGKLRVLVDCGLFQERRMQGRNWAPFPYEPRELDAVLLTHAHLDHCGLLPRLVKAGFKGPIYCTAATAEIARIVLADAARLQEEDAEFKKKRHAREGRGGRYPEVPLYTVDDAEAVSPLFTPVKLGEPARVAGDAEATFVEAGHIFGATSIKLEAGANGRRRSVAFSGDIGRWDRPIIDDPVPIEEADTVVMESTYGDREHDDGDIAETLARAVDETWKRGGNLVIPSFALERAQDLLYYFNELLLANRIPHLLVFLDSPMAIRVLDVFERHTELFDRDMQELVRTGRSPFQFPALKLVSSSDESKALNHLRGTMAVIAGSGMCTGGRVKHHLAHNIERPESTILFVGYQAEGTLGREIVEGAKEVRIHGQKQPVRAAVRRIGGLSGHADRRELIRWLRGFRKAPRRLFLNHGEHDALAALRDYVKSEVGLSATIAPANQRITLD
jgi:metallo-beta-lactamase family protein